MAIKKTQLEELYELYKIRFAHMTEFMDYALENVARSDKAFHKSLEMDGAIGKKTDEIAESVGMTTAFFANKLMNAIFPKSFSRYVQCLKVCGIEVAE